MENMVRNNDTLFRSCNERQNRERKMPWQSKMPLEKKVEPYTNHGPFQKQSTIKRFEEHCILKTFQRYTFNTRLQRAHEKKDEYH